MHSINGSSNKRTGWNDGSGGDKQKMESMKDTNKRDREYGECRDGIEKVQEVGDW
jgi:hypothetical protein